MTDELVFPADFLWGTATAAYQIEGAAREDGRGPSIWDTFSHTPGKVLGGHTGDMACDHVHRFEKDVALVAELGLPAYRFSVAWPRVMPDGRTLNCRGLDFYDRLADELLTHGIKPVLTLYHWDLPQTLEDEGGWLVRDTAFRFAEYALAVHNALGDRVDEWTTLNEPFCAAFLGYGVGVHAPGVTDPLGSLVAGHHLLLAHGLATLGMRAQTRPGHRFSLVQNFSPVLVDIDDDAYLDAGRKFDGLHNRFFLDPVLGKGYPADVVADMAHLGRFTQHVLDDDLATIAAPIDWLGVNYYAPTRIAPSTPDTKVEHWLPGLRNVRPLPHHEPTTSFGWEQRPGSLTDLLVWLGERCPFPLVVAENGASFLDEVTPDGHVHDEERTTYFHEHINAVHHAITAGADVRGYLAWALMDNFEWSKGYSQRFGIIHVDFETQKRVVKDSALFYADVVRANAVAALGPQRRGRRPTTADPWGTTTLVDSRDDD
ncbi:GH1 family beta-glucosidase [Lentzea sp. NPDC006480]|uniref:GH1 family beta-glucosidase n=1 Tax=Lentzea sp. NPDC006480 TaxID=3157176 RepID=UPI0033B2E49E